MIWVGEGKITYLGKISGEWFRAENEIKRGIRKISIMELNNDTLFVYYSRDYWGAVVLSFSLLILVLVTTLPFRP